jgi:amino acid transporter
MPKKRGMKRRHSKNAKSSRSGKKGFTANNDKFKYALKNLVFFGILALIFLGFSSYTYEEFYYNLFLILSVILGAVSLAFFVVLIVLFFAKIMKKK